MKETIAAFKFVLDFLSQLNEEQLSDVINNKAKLKLEYEKVTINQERDTDNVENIKEICNKIEALNSREEAIQYLQSININKNTLKAIVKQYNVPFTSKDTNAQLINKIVEGVVGAKLRFDALLNTNLE